MPENQTNQIKSIIFNRAVSQKQTLKKELLKRYKNEHTKNTIPLPQGIK